MRGTYAALIALSLLVFAPGAVAQNPTYDIPDDDALALAGSAASTADNITDDAEALQGQHQATGGAAVNEASNNQALPATQVQTALSNTAAFGEAAAAEIGDFGDIAIEFANATSQGKLGEIGATITATDAVGGSAFDAARRVVAAVLATACSSPVSPLDCGDDSLVAAAEGAADSILGAAEDEANNADVDSTQAAAEALVGSIVDLPTP